MSTELSISEEEMRSQFYVLVGMEDVARLLDVKKDNFVYHLYKCPIGSKYVTFTIPKRSGGTRTIKAPISSIKIIQKKMNQVLLAVYKQRKPVHSYVRKRNLSLSVLVSLSGVRPVSGCMCKNVSAPGQQKSRFSKQLR